MKKIFLSILVFTLATIAFSVELANVASTKYVFLFIGDGMSIPQRMAADEFVRINTKQGLAINSMPYSAVTTTRAANSFITDVIITLFLRNILNLLTKRIFCDKIITGL